ncbi:MAG: adenylate/guanylate cyclase domain-containing protein, partial [Proteobacteria bacterium]|nr:adenylate/guanylate cyclase domain-containing protein [Pseudomonadota bacterium]
MNALRRWLGAGPVWLLPALLLVVLLFGKLLDPLPLRLLQLDVFDGLQRLQPRETEASPVRIVDLDDESLARLGQWPWPRTLVATLVERLRERGAAVVVLDILFSEPDRTSPARVLEPYRGTYNLPSDLSDLPDHDQVLAETLRRIPAIGGFAFADRAATTPPRLIASFAHSGPDPLPHLPTYQTAVTALPAIEAVLRGYGALNGLPDIDGVTRRVPLLFEFDGVKDPYPSLIAETVRVLAGDRTYKLKTAGGSGEAAFGARTGMVAMRLGSGDGAVTIPTDAHGALLVHFAWPRRDRIVPAWRVLDGSAPATMSDSVVLIGSSAIGLGDLRLTPLGYLPGTEIQAQALEQVLSGEYLERPDWADGLELVVMAIAGLLLVVMLPRLGPASGAALATAVVVLAAGAAWFAFARWRFQFDPIYPAACMTVLYGVTTLLGFMRADADRAFIRNAFSRYISPALVAQLTADPGRLKLGGERREMSFIFTDIAGFTTLSEELGPARVAKLLNPYFDELCRIVLAEGGMVNEFIGDAVLAFFGAPVEQKDHAARAVRAARAIDAAAERFRIEQNAAGVGIGITRIGVHTGTALVGNFGAQARFKYAALGDVVNTASRIEGLNKHFSTRACGSRALFDLAADTDFRPLGDVVVKGRVEALGIVELLDRERAVSPFVARYRDAYAALEAGDVDRATALLRA